MSCFGGAPEPFTGSDWLLFAYLETSEGVYDASGAESISAAVVSSNDLDAELLIAPIAADPGAVGADWANGVVVLSFPASSTDIDQVGTVWLELKVSSNGEAITWPRSSFIAKKGLIP